VLDMSKSQAKHRPQDISLFTPEEEAQLRGRFAGTWTSRLSILVAVLFLGFIGVWVFTSMIAQAKTTTPSQGLVTIHKFIKGFHLAGVSMGMTPEMVKTIHPKFTVLPGDDLTFRGQFVDSHIPYTVWFAKSARGPHAYRIRYHQRFQSSNENETLNFFGRKLGRPLSTSCMRSQLATSAKTCVFKWLRKGVEVTLVSKLIYFINADPRTYVSITATDLLTASKLKKIKMQRQLARNKDQS
jgi:hypothetical protein